MSLYTTCSCTVHVDTAFVDTVATGTVVNPTKTSHKKCNFNIHFNVTINNIYTVLNTLYVSHFLKTVQSTFMV